MRRTPVSIIPVSANQVPSYLRAGDLAREVEKDRKTLLKLKELERERMLLEKRVDKELLRSEAVAKHDEHLAAKMARFEKYNAVRQANVPFKTISSAIDTVTKARDLFHPSPYSAGSRQKVYAEEVALRNQEERRINSIRDKVTNHPDQLNDTEAREWYSKTGEIPKGWDSRIAEWNKVETENLAKLDRERTAAVRQTEADIDLLYQKEKEAVKTKSEVERIAKFRALGAKSAKAGDSVSFSAKRIAAPSLYSKDVLQKADEAASYPSGLQPSWKRRGYSKGWQKLK